MMNLDDTSTLSTTPKEEISQSSPGPQRRFLRIASWGIFSVVSLLVFTLLKLPNDRIGAYIESSISSVLVNRGIILSSEDSNLSLIFGPKYTMKKVTLTSSFPPLSVKLDEVSLSPALLPLFLGKMGGTLQIQQAGGVLKATGSFRENQTSFEFDSKQMDLGKTGLIPLAFGIQAGAILQGNGQIDLDPTDYTTLDTSLSAQLSQVSIDPQVIAGFQIPALNISEGSVDVKTDHGKLLISSVKLGKPGQTTDDIQASISGDITLGKKLESSTLNLKVRFSLSQNVLRSFVILDAILGSGKQADGSYLFTLKGPLLAPMPTPGE